MTPISFSLVALLFWLVYVGFLLTADAGLYMVAWQRSLIALAGRRPTHRLTANTSVDDNDEQQIAGLFDMTDRQRVADLLNPQTSLVEGPQHHFDANWRDCADLRKLVRLPNAQDTGTTAVLQQVLADQTLNFLHCIFVGRLSSSARTL